MWAGWPSGSVLSYLTPRGALDAKHLATSLVAAEARSDVVDAPRKAIARRHVGQPSLSVLGVEMSMRHGADPVQN